MRYKLYILLSIIFLVVSFLFVNTPDVSRYYPIFLYLMAIFLALGIGGLSKERKSKISDDKDLAITKAKARSFEISAIVMWPIFMYLALTYDLYILLVGAILYIGFILIYLYLRSKD